MEYSNTYYYSLVDNSRFNMYKSLANENRRIINDNFNQTANTKKSKKYECEVRIFNEIVTRYEFDRNYTGSNLVSKICQDLNIVEKNFFGLQYLSKLHGNKRWLKPDENIVKAMKGVNNIVFIFMFQYYPSNLIYVEDYMTIYYLIEQLKNDIRNQKIKCSINESIKLSAILFFSQYGSYDREQFKSIHFGRDNLICPEIMNKKETRNEFIHEYKQIQSLTFLQADLLFIDKALNYPGYGEERYHAKSLKSQDIFIGISPKGITVYHPNPEAFSWKSYINCYEMLGNLTILYSDKIGKKQSTMLRTYDNGFLIELFKRNEYAYRMLHKKTYNINITPTKQMINESEYSSEKPPIPKRHNFVLSAEKENEIFTNEMQSPIASETSSNECDERNQLSDQNTDDSWYHSDNSVSSKKSTKALVCDQYVMKGNRTSEPSASSQYSSDESIKTLEENEVQNSANHKESCSENRCLLSFMDNIKSGNSSVTGNIDLLSELNGGEDLELIKKGQWTNLFDEVYRYMDYYELQHDGDCNNETLKQNSLQITEETPKEINDSEKKYNSTSKLEDQTFHESFNPNKLSTKTKKKKGFLWKLIKSLNNYFR